MHQSYWKGRANAMRSSNKTIDAMAALLKECVAELENSGGNPVLVRRIHEVLNPKTKATKTRKPVQLKLIPINNRLTDQFKNETA